MERESDDFEERGERVMVSKRERYVYVCLTFREQETLQLNGQYKLKLIVCVSHDNRTSVTMNCCHLILFAAIPAHLCVANPCPKWNYFKLKM